MKSSKLNTKFFSKENASIIIFLSTAFFFALFFPANISNQLKHGLSLPVLPLQKFSVIAFNNVSSFWGKLFSSEKQGEENEKLKSEIFRLRNMVIKQADIIYKLKNEVNSLTEFYDLETFSEKPIIANVVGHDTLEFRKSFLLDVGTKHGVHNNDTVISGNALIGRIFSVARYSSRVQLITDPEIRIPVKVLETRNQGIITGNAGFVCQMEYVPETAVVKDDYRIVTSGIGKTYPPSIYVGKVSKSKRIEGELFLNILVRPIVDLSKVESVLIIKNKLHDFNK